MIVRSLFAVTLLSSSLSLPLSAQVPPAGAREYTLASSSVGLPRGTGALFMNPAALAHLGENEILINTPRLRSLGSLAGALSIPATGALAIGVDPGIREEVHVFGGGFIIGGHHAIGASLATSEGDVNGPNLTLGSSFHFTDGPRRSGTDLGIVADGLLVKARWLIGVGWWAVPERLRFQVAARSLEERASRIGLDVVVNNSWTVETGLRGIRDPSIGIAYREDVTGLQLAGGRQGMVLTMSFLLGRSQENRRAASADAGYDAFGQGKLAEAAVDFDEAALTDEYDVESRTMADEARRQLDSLVTTMLTTATASEEAKDFPAALRAYSQVLHADPGRTATTRALHDAEDHMREFVRTLILTGDSLRSRRDLAAAQRFYENALQLDPGNDSASSRLDELVSVSREALRTQVSHARTLLQREQLDEAQREFERVLTSEPRNAQARAGLASVDAKRSDKVLSAIRDSIDAGFLYEGLRSLDAFVRRNGENRTARQALDRVRMQLRGDVEKYFRLGLQYYVKEDYRNAIITWDKALLIDPAHAGTLEYRKRADEKLHALEQLK